CDENLGSKKSEPTVPMDCAARHPNLGAATVPADTVVCPHTHVLVTFFDEIQNEGRISQP
ncbi:15603_t:CDS:1, partial [Acaulospora morrowiae]